MSTTHLKPIAPPSNKTSSSASSSLESESKLATLLGHSSDGGVVEDEEGKVRQQKECPQNAKHESHVAAEAEAEAVDEAMEQNAPESGVPATPVDEEDAPVTPSQDSQDVDDAKDAQEDSNNGGTPTNASESATAPNASKRPQTNAPALPANSTVQKMTKMWSNREKRNTIFRGSAITPGGGANGSSTANASRNGAPAYTRINIPPRTPTDDTSPDTDESVSTTPVELPFPTPGQYRQSLRVETPSTPKPLSEVAANVKIIVPTTDSTPPSLRKARTSSSFFGRRKKSNTSKRQSISPKVNSPSHTSYPIIHSGHLTKEGAVFHSWKRRFFVLRENKVLYYHANPKTTQFKGQILLQNTLIKKIESRAYKGKENCFQIYSKEFSRTYYMFADSPQDMDIWIKKLRQVTYGSDESLLKWLILGQKGCGKTSLIRRWQNGVFAKNLPNTEGVEKTICKTTTDEGNVIEIALHEASEESVNIEQLDEELIEDTSCVILMFDLTNRESWDRVKVWLPILKSQLPERLFIILATKMDLVSQRRVPTVVAQLFASKMNVDYMEATATSNSGDYSFGFVVESLVRRGKIGGE